MKLKEVKIGGTVLPHGLILAPMAGFTDLAFRQICHECGADMTVTEMISAKAVCFGDKKTWELAQLPAEPAGNLRHNFTRNLKGSHDHSPGDPYGSPGGSCGKIRSYKTALQIFGHDPADIEEAVRRLINPPSWDERKSTAEASRSMPAGACRPADCAVSQSAAPSWDERKSTAEVSRSMPPRASGGRPTGVDINMGCPVKKIVSSGDGSALMRDPALCGKLVEAAIRGAGDVPVTVKIRAGFDADHKNAAEVARICAAAGAAAITVHGRTREQFYAPSSDNAVIAAVREAVPPEIPVIGNGDITSPEDAERMLRETGCDGIMIGRAALGDPWLFGRIIAAAEGITLPEPAVEERLQMALRLCREVCARYGEARGVPMCRGRAGHFIRGIPGAAVMRDRLCHAGTLAEVEQCLLGMIE